MPNTVMGVFVGNDPAWLDEFTTNTGITPDAVLGYTGGQSWADADPGWQLSQDFLGGTGLPILWSLEMYPRADGVAGLQAAAAGQNNATYEDWAEQILASRSGDTDPIFVRTMWELGGEWFPWTGHAAADPEAFRDAFAQFADVFHGVSDRFKMVWDIVPDRPAFGVENYYPGDEYVDVIGQDVYWQRSFQSQDPAVAFEESVSGHARGLEWVADFAALHGKPVAIPEYAAEGSGDGTDAGVWLSLMEGWLDANNVAFATYWNGGDGSGYDSEIRPGRWPAAVDDIQDIFATPGTYEFEGDPGPTYDTPAAYGAGTGPDELVLLVSDEEWPDGGAAQFTVEVDNVQIGSTFTVSADKASGLSDTVSLLGDWGPGEHTVEVNFTNDTWGGTAETDRNLFVDGATFNDVLVPDSEFEIENEWSPNTFDFTEGGGSTEDPGANLSAGTGPDTLVLKITEKEYAVSAQYTVEVDDVQVGGTFTASADHGSSQLDTLTLNGDWAAGQHTVTVNFLNDQWGGTSETDSNLWVESATYNSVAIGTGLPLEIYNENPPNTFTFTDTGSGGGDPNVWPEPSPDPNPNYSYPLKNDWNGIGQLVTLFNQYGDPPDVQPGQWWPADDIVAIGWQPTDAMLA